MKAINKPRQARGSSSRGPVSLSRTSLNAYELEFPVGFQVPVNTYVVQRVGDQVLTDDDRGEAVGIIWDYWRQNKHHCGVLRKSTSARKNGVFSTGWTTR